MIKTCRNAVFFLLSVCFSLLLYINFYVQKLPCFYLQEQKRKLFKIFKQNICNNFIRYKEEIFLSCKEPGHENIKSRFCLVSVGKVDIILRVYCKNSRKRLRKNVDTLKFLMQIRLFKFTLFTFACSSRLSGYTV